MNRRIGAFRIHREFLEKGDNAALKIMFSNVIVLEARHNYRTQAVEYVAISDIFKPLEDHLDAPDYEIIFNRFGENLTITARRCEPAPILNYSLKQKIARLKMAIKAFFK